MLISCFESAFVRAADKDIGRIPDNLACFSTKQMRLNLMERDFVVSVATGSFTPTDLDICTVPASASIGVVTSNMLLQVFEHVDMVTTDILATFLMAAAAQQCKRRCAVGRIIAKYEEAPLKLESSSSQPPSLMSAR